MNLASKTTNFLKNTLSKKYPKIADLDFNNLKQYVDPGIAAEFSELPYHAVNKTLAQFKGRPGVNNLLKGLGTGGALSGLSLGADYINDNDPSKGRATALGTLGLVAPGMYSGSRAGFLAAKNFAKAVKNLSSRGISVLSKDEKTNKINLINNLLNDQSIQDNPKDFIKRIFTDKDYRSNLSNIFKPGTSVEVGYLNNSQGSIDAMMPELAAMAQQFGRKHLNAGNIVNPNIAHKVQSGALNKALKLIGYERFSGSTKPTTTLAPELSNALTSRFYKITNKKNKLNKSFEDLSDEERKNFLPTGESFFPFNFSNSEGADILLSKAKPNTVSARELMHMSPEAIMNLKQSLSVSDWDTLGYEAKEWLKTQGIGDSKSYANLMQQIATFVEHANTAAKTNPKEFATKFKLPSLRHLFADNDSFDFDYNL